MGEDPETAKAGVSVAYRELANTLREAILRGEYADGRQMPTEQDLSESFGVSRQTVRRGLQDLVAEGLIFRVRGRGTFAMSDAGRNGRRYLRSVGTINDLLAVAADTELEVIRPFQRRTDLQAAGRLHLESDEVMDIILRRLNNGLPFCHSHVYLPPSIGESVTLSGFPHETRDGYLTSIIGVIELTGTPIGRASQSVTAEIVADEEIAAAIDCEPGDPVLRIDRLFFDATDNPVQLGVNYMNPERYSYRVELRGAPSASVVQA